MGKLELIQEYFSNQNLEINLWQFGADVALTSLCALVLSRIYIAFSKSLSNKKAFSSNFITLALTTMMIITIVKSSIALSLGLVGALSIVRFRAAIKDPEELVYLFLCISLGLGFGAGQRYISLLFFASICLIIILKSKIKRDISDNGVFLSVTNSEMGFLDLTETIKGFCDYLELNRIDNSNEKTDAYFLLKTKNVAELDKLIQNIRTRDPKCGISFTHNKGLLS